MKEKNIYKSCQLQPESNMEQRERRALDRCFDDLLKDLDPTPPFLHSLYAEKILTEEQVDRIQGHSSRETQVAMLLRYLPQRGPMAFSVFKEKLGKDYPWLSQKLGDELKRLQSSQTNINRKLVTVVSKQLMPLVYSCNKGGSEGDSKDFCNDQTHPVVIIQKLSELLTNLQRKCLRALDLELQVSSEPIHKLIQERLKDEQRRAVEENLVELNREVKELRKQLRDAMKLKTENEKMKCIVSRQKEKLKDYAKLTRENKRMKTEVEKCKKETDILKYEIESLRDQLRGNIANMYA